MSIYMLIGLPRSGKSTWAKRHQESEGTPIVSADNLRYLVYGQRFWGNGEQLMWAIRAIILNMLLEQDIDIIIDETNTTKERRKSIIDLARNYKHDVFGIVMIDSKGECIRRALSMNDETIIPVIERMAEQYAAEPPSIEEGFKDIIFVKGGGL